MRVSLQWLRELVQVGPEELEAERLAERLSMAGFEVESIEDLAAQAAGVVVGLVEDRQAHPDADKLSVCRVNVGGEEALQIVCGASNVRAGIHVPVTLVGATLPAAPVRPLDATLSVADIVALTGSSRWTVRRLLRQWQRAGGPSIAKGNQRVLRPGKALLNDNLSVCQRIANCNDNRWFIIRKTDTLASGEAGLFHHN